MRSKHEKYICFPSVVCVGKETDVTIFPRDISRRFRDDKEYELAIIGIDDDEFDFNTFIPFTHPCTVKDGCLHFTYIFEKEQEYGIRFREKGTAMIKIFMYAVKEDLYELRPLKGDLHSHSYYSDGEDGLSMTPANYREQGFDFFALTDHNRRYPSVLAEEFYKDIPLGLHIMKGEEIHTPDSQLHIVHVGGTESVCDKYIHHREEFDKAIVEIEATLTHVPEQYRRKTAMAKWSCEEVHRVGGIAIFAHPLWRPRSYNIPKEFADILFEEKIFDAFELMGGIRASSRNLQIALWQEHAIKGNILPTVGSSDSHNQDFAAGSFGKRFTYVFAKSNTTEDIMDAIRKGYCVAADLSKDDETEAHFYSTQYRLVLFAHFLFQHYFDETCRLCFGEGILMRRFAEGEPVGDTLTALSDTVENFYKKFYGLTPAPHLTQHQKEHLDKCLYAQRTIGPITKDSKLFIVEKEHNERRE